MVSNTHNTSALTITPIDPHRGKQTRGRGGRLLRRSRGGHSPGSKASSAKATNIGAIAATRGHTTPAHAALARRRAHAAWDNVRPARAAPGAGLGAPAPGAPLRAPHALAPARPVPRAPLRSRQDRCARHPADLSSTPWKSLYYHLENKIITQ